MESELFGMKLYEKDMVIKDCVTYGRMEFDHFSVQEVYVEDKQKGEYHIKLHGFKDPSYAVVFFRRYFLSDCSVGLVDPSGLLNLEYPIYLICKNNPLVMSAINEIFSKIDEDMCKKV